MFFFLIGAFKLFFSCIAIGEDFSSLKETDAIGVVTFNVLAPCWIKEDYDEFFGALLDRVYRRERIIQILKELAKRADIFFLQETTETEFKFFASAMSEEYDAFQAFHDQTHWANWLPSPHSWEPNGVAILARRSKIKVLKFEDIAVIKFGGAHMAYAEAILASSNQKLRMASVHFDDDPEKAQQELTGVLAHFPVIPNVIDIIAGDTNALICDGDLEHRLIEQGFVDTIDELGREQPTHPYQPTWDPYGHWAVLDYIFVRHAEPICGDVISYDLYKKFPHEADIVRRAYQALMRCGSDHFPIFVKMLAKA